MDNFVVDDSAVDGPRPPATASFRPDRRYTAAAAGGALLAVVLLALTGDAPGRLLFGLAGLVLLGYAVGDLVFSPRLVASAHGVTIRAPLTRAALGWAEIESVRADSSTRHGLRSLTLEIDAGATLAVFSRRALGHDPEDVARIVNAFRPPDVPPARPLDDRA